MIKRTVLFSVLFALLLAVQAMAAQLAVKVDRANIRSGPGTDNEILWSVGKYYPLDVIKKSGNWYKTRDFENDVGWIFHTLIEKIPTVIVKVPLVNIRKGPGTNFRALFQAEKGVSFKLLSEQGKWFKIKHADGEIGWIHRSMVWGY
ncbi:MAG: hypothetical protein BBJ60_03725 [Desulfobacterales bacterium S7086C20]|nr:MAG: hypothetical protein BBJ60_03725 [Desulfobacterales bacterium S7086C20]